ncbi:MAG: MaoC family dehydratase N-terminal domain-containing protein [Chloroflexi bacterium]|nr:MaoC family dehydratase N-terminal domain-containing protein [Chloroflexota bacterium]
MAQHQPDEMAGKITPDGVARMRARIGILVGGRRPWNRTANEDTIRHFVNGVGDDNPLFVDPEYAAGTRWKGIIASPGFEVTMGISKRVTVPPEVREKGAHALSGVPNYYSGSSQDYYRPIRPGDTLYNRRFVSDVVEKRSEFGGGKSVVVYHKSEFINQRDELVALVTTYFVHAEREASEKTGKYLDVPEPSYDDDYLAKIDEAYENERHRGAETRYWEETEEGEEMPLMVRGPLTVTDVIVHHTGIGMGGFNVAATKLGYKNRKRIPNFYTRNEFNAWDCAQRVHWDNRRAKLIGNPRSYDYGVMRTHWLSNALTNWMGDDAWLYKFSDQTRKFNFQGDTSWIHGKVAKKYVDGPHRCVDLELWIENQRDEITTPATATVLLPSKEAGPVALPGDTGEYKPSVMNTDYSVEA